MISLLRKRRSVRAFARKPLAPDAVVELKEVCLRAPSSRNIKPWRFVFVTDTRLLGKMSKCKPHGAEFLADAALGVVICADTRKSDVWIEDCSIAAVLLQLASLELGLGSCWAQVRLRPHKGRMSAEQYLRKLLRMPDHVAIECVIGIGHPAEHPRPVPRGRLDWKKILHNRYAGG